MSSNSSESQVDYAIQVNIELEDLQELATINPLAWEQLLHIADNRRNAERVAELEIQLQYMPEKINEKA